MANRRFLTNEELRNCLNQAAGIIFTAEWRTKNGDPIMTSIQAYDAQASILLHHIIQRKLAEINEA